MRSSRETDTDLREWVSQLAERDPSVPALPRVLDTLRERIGLHVGIAYRAEPLRGLEFVHVSGRLLTDHNELSLGMSDTISRSVAFGLYDPFCPQPEQRNHARLVTAETNAV